jgi:hypothetical protein
VAIDSRDKRASAIAGTLAPLIVPFNPDAAIGAADRQHVGGWIYRGIAAAAPVTAALPYQGDVYFYDETTGTGAIGSGAVQSGDTIYDDATGTGSVSGGTVQPSETIYD